MFCPEGKTRKKRERTHTPGQIVRPPPREPLHHHLYGVLIITNSSKRLVSSILSPSPRVVQSHADLLLYAYDIY